MGIFRSKKFLIGIAVFVLVVAVLLLTGVLEFSFTMTKTDQPVTSDETSQKSGSADDETEKVSQQSSLASRPVRFKGMDDQVEFSINLPVGWSTAVDDRANLIAGSQIPEELPDGQTFTANMNAIIDKHSPGMTSFSDYQTKWKDEMLAQYPSMEFISEYSTKINGMEVYVLNVNNSRPDGLVIHQTQYMFYIDDEFAMALTASAPTDSWSKYECVIKKSVESLENVSAKSDEQPL